ncbi:SpaA isopeptide-forming pilin-related protein [Bacillus sp. REN10]|uniref:MSCRAMM family protein n=1 Tax=Bacillus sp. REN10 TaxID=2782541 RepID=UPI00193AECB8|nr:SpaA isopeptide-forming pilin-related protein [Bacillus sp. REN10]
MATIQKRMPAIIGFLFGLCMMINAFPPMAHAQKTAADVVKQIRLLDAKGQSKNSFHEYEDVKIEIEWSAKAALQAKDQVVIELPKELEAHVEKVPMKDSTGKSIGQCTSSKTTITCVYDEAVKANTKGMILLPAKIKEVEEQEADKKLAFKVNGESQYVAVHLVADNGKKDGEKTAAKSSNQKVKPAAVTDGTVNENPKPQAHIQIVKVDEEDQNKLLAGAYFDLLQNGKIVDSLVTDADGRATSKQLLAGTYTLKETKAPTGYQLLGKTIDVKVESERDVLLIVPNVKELGSLKVLKKDGKTGALLKGAQFRLYDEEGHSVSQPKTTDQNGVVLFEKLASGQYLLEETKAPEGYNASNVRYSVKIVAGEVTQLEVKNEKKASLPKQPISSHGTGVGIPVKKPNSSTTITKKPTTSSTTKNKQKSNTNSSKKLPQTGDAGSMAPILGAILIAAAIRLKI